MADECSNQLANERVVWDVRQFVSMTRPGINEVMFFVFCVYFFGLQDRDDQFTFIVKASIKFPIYIIK